MVVVAHPGRLPVDLNRRVSVEPHELLREQRELAALHQVLLPLRAFHILRVGQHALQVAVLLEQLFRYLRPDQRHARHIVDLVSHQGLEIDHLLGADAPVGLEGNFVVDEVFADVVNRHVVRNQLAAVLVAGHQAADGAGLVALLGHGGEHVVGLVIRDRADGDPERPDNLFDLGELRPQLAGRFAPLALVDRVELVPEGVSRGVERTDQRVGPLVLQELQQVLGEAEDRVDRLAAGAGHLRDRVEHLEDQRVGVDHVDGPAGRGIRCHVADAPARGRQRDTSLDGPKSGSVLTTNAREAG